MKMNSRFTVCSIAVSLVLLAANHNAHAQPAPAITGIAPPAAAPGAAVTVSGAHFNPVAADNVVFFGAVRATVTSASSSALTVTVPAGATYAPVTVAVNGLVAFSSAPFQPTFAGAGADIDASSFASPVTLGAGDGAHRSAVGDLDGDGKPDLAIADVYGHTISLFRNISSPGALDASSFEARVVLTAPDGAGDNPYGFIVADVDGDGKLDLVACDRIGNHISVYRNVANPGTLTTGSFAPRVDFSVGADPRYAKVADLDGDGRPDIVSCNYAGDTLSVLRNVGVAGVIEAGSFAPALDIPAGHGPYDVAIADLDGDGKPDLAAVNAEESTTSLFRNISTAGAIAFVRAADLPALVGNDTIAAGDVDGDGKLDLVIGAYHSRTMAVYRNQSSVGSMAFAARTDFDTGNWTHTVAMGDLNGDAKADLAVVGELNSYLSVFQNVSTPGTFDAGSLAPRVDFGAGWNAWGVSVGDLDGDKRPDIVFCNAYDDNVFVYRNVVPMAPVCVPAPDGLVGWWPLNGDWSDVMEANPGVPSGNPVFASAKVDQGMVFDFIDDAVRVPAAPDLNVGAGAGMSIEMWIQPASIATQKPLLEWNNSAGFIGAHFWIAVAAYGGGPGSLYANLVDTAGGHHAISSPPRLLTTTALQHVAVTYDKASGMAILYLNGNPVASQNLGTFTPDTTDDLYFGLRTSGAAAGARFAGIMDEISLYNRALAGSEVRAIFDAGSAGKCAPEDNGPPVARMTVSPLAEFPGMADLIVISRNRTDAVVVLDGSLSSDPDNDPLEYWWFDGLEPVGSGVSVTNRLAIGTHELTLVVSDGASTNSDSRTVEVITAGQAVGIIIQMVQNSDLPRNRKRPLLASLVSAAAAFDRGNLHGVNQLLAFVHKVQAQVAPIDPELARDLRSAALAIVEAVAGNVHRLPARTHERSAGPGPARMR